MKLALPRSLLAASALATGIMVANVRCADDGGISPVVISDAGQEAAAALDAGGIIDANSGTDAGSDANACVSLSRRNRELPNDAANVTCAIDADCKIVSSDLCYNLPTVSLNATGIAARTALAGEYEKSSQCRGLDCGSGGGVTLTPACRESTCVALLSDGGAYR